MSKAPRKWSNLKGVLPDAPDESSDWTQKVLAAKDRRANKNMLELVQEYNRLAKAEETAKAQERSRNVLYEAIERRMLEELEQVKAVSGDDLWRGEGHIFTPKFDIMTVVEDVPKFLQWIKDTDQESILRVMPGTVKSMTGEAMNTDLVVMLTPAQRAGLKPGESGSGAPPPGVKVFFKQGIRRIRS